MSHVTGRPVPPEQRPGRDVVAVVLTHRRPHLATQVVSRLVAEEGFDPGQVVLVVNGEGGLEDAALEAAVRVLRLPTNTGPAGGFYAGLVEATADPAVHWAYLCEDDVGLFDLPAPRVRRVIELVEARPGPGRVGAVVAYGRKLTGRGAVSLPHIPEQEEGLEPVDLAAWGATLVSAEVVRAKVLPDPELFFGYEDFDFFLALSEAGFELLVDRRTARAAAGQMSLAGRDAALRGSRPSDAQEPWRAYYEARNMFALARRHGNWRWTAWHLLYSVRRVQVARSRAVAAAAAAGLFDGFRGRLGCNPRFVRRVGEWAPGTAP